MTEWLRDGERSWGRTLGCPVPNPGPVLTCRWPPRARNGTQQVP